MGVAAPPDIHTEGLTAAWRAGGAREEGCVGGVRGSRGAAAARSSPPPAARPNGGGFEGESEGGRRAADCCIGKAAREGGDQSEPERRAALCLGVGKVGPGSVRRAPASPRAVTNGPQTRKVDLAIARSPRLRFRERDFLLFSLFCQRGSLGVREDETMRLGGSQKRNERVFPSVNFAGILDTVTSEEAFV